MKPLETTFPDLEVVPTGGVNLNTAAEFLAAGATALGVGAEFVDAEAIASARLES